MKSKTRLFVLVAVVVTCFAYILWPNTSLQNFLFNDVSSSAQLSFEPEKLERNCMAYFNALESKTSSRATTSRYLLSHQISNHIAHLRVFCECYVQNANEVPASISYEEIQPMFSGLLPVMKGKHPASEVKLPSRSYWRNYLDALSGKGIVIGIHDKEVDYATRLLRVLNHLGNELPIQFVHEGDLLPESVFTLLEAAKLTEGSISQNIDFISIRPAITAGYQSIFKGYNNKWFAALFTTFEEIILMDADAVPFVKPSSFFELEGYKKTGAYFFRDRELSEALKQDQVDFFLGMIPADGSVFEYKIDPAQLQNNFFKYNSKHVMESGVVVMNRLSHMLGLLVSLSLQYWFQSGRIMYGDKDLFWLGQLISGNSNYYFNEYAAAAIGELEGELDLCSAQLGHLSKDKKLLWTNGTLLKCKKNTWLADFFKYPALRQKCGNSMAKMKEAYSSAITISECILPASIPEINGLNKRKVTGNFNKNYNRGCGGIYYCATSKDGGEVVRFTEEEKKHYNKIVSIWNSSI